MGEEIRDYFNAGMAILIQRGYAEERDANFRITRKFLDDYRKASYLTKKKDAALRFLFSGLNPEEYEHALYVTNALIEEAEKQLGKKLI